MSTSERAPTSARPDRRWLVALGLLVAAAVVVAVTTDGSVLRLIGGVAVVVVPGAALVTILRVRPRDRAEAVVLALGLGLASLIIGGLLIDLVASLSPAGWAGLIVVLVGVALLTARPRAKAAEATLVDHARDAGTVGTAGTVDEDAVDVDRVDDLHDTEPARKRAWPLFAITGAVCAIAVGIALSIAVDSAREQSGVGFTALGFELDRGAPADERPETVGIVVENRERVPSTYRLVVNQGDRTLLDEELQLAADEVARREVSTDGLESGVQVQARLYRDGGTEAYRAITYTLP
jgi:hypothetical protein